jgi:excisionase family DNA binding protein
MMATHDERERRDPLDDTPATTPDASHAPQDDEILTSREARELLKIGRTKLWELTRKNAIPAYRLGDGKSSDLRYKRSELLAFLDRCRV